MSEVEINKIRTNGGTQPRTNLYEEIVFEYTEALQGGAEFPPVVVFYDGSDYWLADGFHRFHAYRQARGETIPAEVHQGTRREAILYSVGANSAHGLRRTSEDKRRAVGTLLNDEEWSQWKQAEIAKACGVSREFVSRVQTELKDSGDLTCDRSQVTYTTRHGTQATMNTENIGRSSVGDEASSPPNNEEQPPPPQSTGSFHVSTGEVEWYTPSDFIDKVRLVMGSIDTDPASSDTAQKTVQAENYYTKEHDGLSAEWHGCVFVNPPYSMPDVEQFADRAVRAVSDGECEQMIMLVNNATDTDWFHRILAAFDRVCLTDGRVRFYNNNGETLQTRQGQAVFYFGENREKFRNVFSDEGAVLIKDS